MNFKSKLNAVARVQCNTSKVTFDKQVTWSWGIKCSCVSNSQASTYQNWGGDSYGMYFYRNDFWTPGQISLLSYCNCNEGYIGGIAPIYTWGNWYTLTVSANASGYVFAYLNGSLLYQQQFTGFVRWYQRHTTTGMPAASPIFLKKLNY